MQAISVRYEERSLNLTRLCGNSECPYKLDQVRCCNDCSCIWRALGVPCILLLLLEVVKLLFLPSFRISLLRQCCDAGRIAHYKSAQILPAFSLPKHTIFQMTSPGSLSQLLSTNAEWAAEVTAKDPHFHKEQARGPQEPKVCRALLTRSIRPTILTILSGSVDRVLRLASPRCSDHQVETGRSVCPYEYGQVSHCFSHFKRL